MSRSFAARLLAAGLATAVVTVVLVAAPGSASRTVSESYAVPTSGTLQLTGHGFGHGHGMSQYGAQGAAKQGLTWRQIVSFYYPGTTIAATTGGIRVRLMAASTGNLVVANATGLQMRQAGSTTSYPVTGTGVSWWRLRKSGSATVLDSYDGAWHDGVRSLAGAAELYGPATLRLKISGTTRDYRGSLRLTTEGYTVDVVSMDDYVKGVVPREMPASWLPEALRAQAVAARTYAAYDRAAHPTRSYDTCDTTSCQVYGGASSEDSRSTAAVVATANQVVNYGGKPAFTQFGSSDGGWTSAGSMPYLPAKADPYDGFSGNPVHTWTNTVTKAAVQRAWPSLGTLTRVVVTQRDGNGEWYGRVETMVLDGTKNNVTISGDTFRSRFGLRSSWFHFGAGSATSTPAPTQTTATSPITARWRAIGGYHSILGGPVAAERAAAGGRVRVFRHGRIYWSASTGAHELYKRMLTAYLRRGGAVGRLGFPLTSPHKVGRRIRATFQHGTLTARRHGRVHVIWR
jgi:stage II sporulation protein D